MAHHQCLNLPFLECLGIPQSLVSVCRKTKTLVLESPSPGTLSCLLLKLERNVVYISSETLAKKILIFTFVSSCQLGIASEFGMGACVHFCSQG